MERELQRQLERKDKNCRIDRENKNDWRERKETETEKDLPNNKGTNADKIKIQVKLKFFEMVLLNNLDKTEL